MAVIKSLKKEVKVAAPEIFFRIYILIQSGFSLYCRVLILQWCPKKFVGKEKKFQGFHYCQKVDKKGREIYTQFSNNSLHALIWPNWLSTLKNTRCFDKTDLVSHSLEKSQFCKTSSKRVFFPEETVKFNRQDERKNCTEFGNSAEPTSNFQVFPPFCVFVYKTRPVSAQSQLSSKQEKAPKFWYFRCNGQDALLTWILKRWWCCNYMWVNFRISSLCLPKTAAAAC